MIRMLCARTILGEEIEILCLFFLKFRGLLYAYKAENTFIIF